METSQPPRRDLPLAESRADLMQHFQQFQGPDYLEGWASLWDKGDFLPWDRFAPSPALVDTLLHRTNLIGTSRITVNGQTRRKKALVPGCGRGVDVLLLESFGYDAVGLDYSATAVREAREWAAQHDGEYKTHDETLGRGTKKFVAGDFFSDDWKEEAGVGRDGHFDLIYDYTFFCALNPSMRPAWAKRMTELLAPHAQANLICLEFPTVKQASSGGPPFASPPKAYMEHLSHPGETVRYDAEGNVVMNPLAESSPNALERVGHWQPPNTHKPGKDEAGFVQDWIAIWRHR